MKKYFFEAEIYSGVGYPVEWNGQPEEEYYGGLYVPADLAEEMLQNLRDILTYVQLNYPENHTLINMVQNAIKKAEKV